MKRERFTATSGDESDIDAEEWTKASRRDQVAFDATFAATNRVPTRAATEQKLTGFLILLLLPLNLNLLPRLHRSHFQRSNFFFFELSSLKNSRSNGQFLKIEEKTKKEERRN